MVVNRLYMKAVPGRKTNVKDAEWIADLFSMVCYNKDQRELRGLVRYRKILLGEYPRIKPSPEDTGRANIKLSGTVSDINEKSARRILEGSFCTLGIRKLMFHSNIMWSVY